jgi:hypothetical protein
VRSRGPDAREERASRPSRPGRLSPCRGESDRQWQPAQLERTQLPQLELPDPPEEPPPEFFDDPPIANVEKAFRHFLQPQSGQEGFLSRFERTKTSKRLPQRSQSYSKIGIRRPLSKGRQSQATRPNHTKTHDSV